MFARALVLLLFFSLLQPCQGQFKVLLGKGYAQRSSFLDSAFYNGKALQQDSVSFFRRVGSLAEMARLADDEELLLEAELIKCGYYLLGKQANAAIFEPRALALKEIADEKKIRHLQIRTRQYLGYFFFIHKDEYELGFDNYLSSYQLLKDVPVTELPNKQNMITNIGMAYYRFGDKDMALKFLSKASNLPVSNNKQDFIGLNNTLGLIYRQKRRYDSADFYLRKTYQIAKAEKDSTWMGIAAGNIGISFYHQKKYDEAIPLLEQDVKASLKAGEIDNAITSIIVLARISILNKDLAKAEGQIEQVQNLLSRANTPFLHKRDLFPLLAKYFVAKGNFPLAYLYSDSAHFVKDSLYTQNQRILTSKADRKFELQLHQVQMQRLEAQKNLQKTLRNSLVIVLLLLLVIGYLVINRQRLLYRQKQEKLQAANNLMAYELELASQRLNDFTNCIREKNKLIEQISADIEKRKDELNTADQLANKEARDKLLQSTILTDDQWQEFRQVFDKVHTGYLDRLRTKLPNLSPAETRYLVLSKLDLSVKEMSSMLGISPDAVRLCRHRLRKKLNIEEEKVLEDLMQQI